MQNRRPANTWARLKSVALALYYTFRSSRKLQKLHRQDPKIAWDDPQIQKITHEWGQQCLKVLNIRLRVSGAQPSQGPCLFLGNHMSYLDIMALYTVKHVCFIAKKEVGTWPIIGVATKMAGSIFVDRASARSKALVAQEIGRSLLEEKKSIGLFPEGSTSVEGLAWRKGIFKVAQEKGIPIQVFHLCYKPARSAAYIDDDSLLSHLLGLLQNHPIELEMELLEPEMVINADESAQRHEQLARQYVHKKLQEQGYFDSQKAYL